MNVVLQLNGITGKIGHLCYSQETSVPLSTSMSNRLDEAVALLARTITQQIRRTFGGRVLLQRGR